MHQAALLSRGEQRAALEDFMQTELLSENQRDLYQFALDADIIIHPVGFRLILGLLALDVKPEDICHVLEDVLCPATSTLL
ncbi:unnamed protein product [Darwinula stevensoni]|uniref:Uncharacterized protein n=1 Tax=Darwinula stevensoni TaxID=69355 RepID=A0A7R9A2K4_9CRUS|nr:unnamed protein product [Darwinula stevensoni]CAG0880127.1 unnamed protein product [Darwinula stevensoni]